MENLVNLRQTLKATGSLRNMPPLARREFRNGMLYLTPWIIGFIGFTVIPMIASLIFSFMDIRILDGVFSSPKWVGFNNYKTMFTDPSVWNANAETGAPGAIWVTIRFGLIALPVGLLMPLGLALLMNNKYLKGKSFFRSLFYMPYIIPFVASVVLWGGMLNPTAGWINKSLIAMGLPRDAVPLWANDVHWVYPAYVIMGLWGVGNAMLTMLAGIQSVPTDLFDACKVDGAGPWKTFWNVTFPMVSPVIFYNLVLSIVGLFQYFLVPLVVNQGTGRPSGSTFFYNLYLYKTFFVYQNMSYGSTLAWLLFIVILFVTVLLFSTARYWVYYASENP
jgi:ABC-type sugar transport system permease subunit